MERRRRRYWTWTVTGIAMLVLAAATASGVFQLVVQAAPGYKLDIEKYVSDIAGRPVRIGTLDLTWRYTYPSLDLGKVALLDASGKEVLLEAERLRIGFSLRRLVQRNFTPNRLELHGLSLDVDIDAAGRISVAGFEASEDAGSGSLEPLAKFDQLRLERCRLNLRDQRLKTGRATVEPRSFGLAYAELSRGLLHSTLESELALPADLGELARVEATLQGDWLDLSTWAGDWSAEITGINAATWLEPWLANGAELQAEEVSVRAQGELKGGGLQSLQVELDTASVRAVREPHRAGFDSLKARAESTFTDAGWEARITRLEIGSEAGPSPDTRIRVAASLDGDAQVWEGDAQQIRLADFSPWLRLLQVPDAFLALDRLAGDVGTVAFSARNDASGLRYQARLGFSGLALPAGDYAVGAHGLGGELALDESGGRVVLRPAPASLQLPSLLETGEVALENLEGEAQWRRTGSDWNVEVPRFRWQGMGTEGDGRMLLKLPAGRSPQLDLDANLAASDVTRAKPLMPRHWGRPLKNWLDRAILGGRVSKGRLKIKGPLEDFPFIAKPGTWELDLDAQDIQLAFHPDWPSLDGLAAKVKFRRNGVSVESRSGTVGGNPIESATAEIAEFKAAQLVVTGRTRGDAKRYFDYLSATPLRKPLDGLLSNQVQGVASAEVQLDVPLKEGGHTRVRGVARSEGLSLKHPSLQEPFKEIRGEVSFDDAAVRADALQARWYGLPLKAQIHPQADGSNLLGTELEFKVDEGGRGPSELIPAWLRKVASGTLRWQAALRFGGPAQGAPLKLVSDLSGVAVDLPAPLGKAAAELMPLEMTVGSAADSPLRITLDYRERMGADLRFRRRDGRSQLHAVALRLGGGPLIEARGPGISLGGAAGEIDARAWYETLGHMGFGDSDLGLKRADIHVARAYWNEYALRDVRYQWQGEARNGWTLALVGSGAAGTLGWTPQRGGRLSGQLESLVLELSDAREEVRPPSDPGQWPTAEIEVARFRLNQADLGRLQLHSERLESGQRLKRLSLSGGSSTLAASGEWRRQAPKGSPAQSTGSLDFDLGTSDIAGLLRALRYAPNLDAKKGSLKAQLSWEPSTTGLDWRQGRGTVKVAFENGQLRAVEPGAGRVLGLVNFYALPRRLTLNFRDVVSSGLGFDKIEGDFALAGGDAVTQNLEIIGPSLRMETRGRIGLAARDYDQQVTVYPDVSAGVTLGALALGGPVIGVLALIAQELFDKPLDQVTQLSYRLTGSWDNPQVAKVDNPAPPPKRASGSPARTP